MKKKSILNRPMFRQVKSPAYGTGIASNLISNEERQRYNYGGRVRAADGLFTQADAIKQAEKEAFGSPFKRDIYSGIAKGGDYLENYLWQPLITGGDKLQDYLTGTEYGKDKNWFGERDTYGPTYEKYIKPRAREIWKEKGEEGLTQQHPRKMLEASVAVDDSVIDDSVIDDSVTEETPTRSERQPGWDLTEDSYSNFLKGRKKITPEGYEGVINTDLMSDEINIDFENKKQKAKDLAKTLALFKGAEIAGNVFSQPTKAKMLGAFGKGIGELGPTVTKPLADVRKTEDVFEMQKALLRENGMEAQKKQILSDKNRFNMLTQANEWNKDLQKEMAHLDFLNKKALKELDPDGKFTKSETFLALVSKDRSAANKANVLNILTDRGATVFDTKGGTKAPKNMRQGDIVVDAQRKTIFVVDENGVLQPTSLAEFGINVEETFAPN